MNRHDNCLIKGTHASRYIMSYIRMGGNVSKRAGRSDFEDWLRSLPLDLTEEEVDHISDMANSGKVEFEYDAKRFIENRKNTEL